MSLIYKQKQPRAELVQEIVKGCQVSELVAKVLVNRGVESVEQAKAYFEHSVKQIHDPFLLKDMDVAVSRIVQAIQNKESICVYGDYDVDGAVATSLLIHFFREIDFPIQYYIPCRMTEGYSMGSLGLKRLKQNGTNLIITVDNGIMAFDAVDEAAELGMDVIVTDHHQVADQLPNAVAVVNPQRKDCAYPFKGICGAGVAFKLLMALRLKLRDIDYFKDKTEPNLKAHLDLLAIATVCDVVPLVQENRFFVKEGLKRLPHTRKVGLKALLDVCDLQHEIRASDLGFQLGPRINACGRLEHASLGVELLVETDEIEAWNKAVYLNNLNQERRDIEKTIVEDALQKILNIEQGDDAPAFVVQDDEWHEGVVGIVASRIVDRFKKPAFVLSQAEDGNFKGSGRSTGTINLIEALRECDDLLLKYGGHEAAAGLSLNPKNLDEFRIRFQEAVKKQTQDGFDVKELWVDEVLSSKQISKDLVRELAQLEPYGMGNAKPVFASQKVKVIEKRIVGQDHLKLKVSDEGCDLDAIAFRQAEHFDQIQDLVDLVYGVEINSFRNKETVQLVVKEMDCKVQIANCKLKK